MPYIDRKARREILTGQRSPQTAGELNFFITMTIVAYTKEHGVGYQAMNDVVGALDNAKDEFRRRVQHPYEDVKCEVNGDVYADLLTAPRDGASTSDAVADAPRHTACGTSDCCGQCLPPGAIRGPVGDDSVFYTTGPDAAPGYGYHNDPGVA